MSSSDWTIDRTKVKIRKKPPKRPWLDMVLPVWYMIYVVTCGFLSYLDQNKRGRYGVAAWDGLWFMANSYLLYVRYQWWRWEQYYKVKMPTTSGYFRWIVVAILVSSLGNDAYKLLFLDKMPWMR